MQIFALDENSLLKRAFHAQKGKDYFCPECAAIVHLKAGTRKSPHFFHLNRSFSCRQAKKGEIHLKLQQCIQNLFEEEEGEMEKAFPSIGRIADVACTASKRVYEIQYSPMTLEEAKARCSDYESLGFEVIWILHEDTFKRRKKSPSEQFLQTKICYYTNMDKEGNGVIYDWIEGWGKRPVNLGKSFSLPKRTWPKSLSARGKAWSLFHEGDFFDLALQKRLPHSTGSMKPLKALKEAYLAFLHILLKKSCKNFDIFE